MIRVCECESPQLTPHPSPPPNRKSVNTSPPPIQNTASCVGKLGSTSPPPIHRKWAREEAGKRPLITSSELPHHLYRKRPRGEARVNFLTTYTEERLVGKLGSTSSPPIQKEVSWGSSGQLPHHLYKRRARGEAGKRPQLTPLSSPPPIQKRGSWGSSSQLPHHLYKRRARGEAHNMSADYTPHPTPTSSPPIEMTGSWGSARAQLPHHLYR